MASQNIARLGVVLGLDTAEFTAQVDKAISENKKLKDAIKRDSQAALKESAALKLAAEDYGKTLTKVQQIEREISSGRFMNATKEMKQQLLERAAAYDKVAMSTKNATAAQFKMNEQQKLALTYQTTDLFTQIASGQSPFIALIQQGGQLKDQMGGLGNAFKAIRSVLTPTVLGFGAVATVLGAVGLAAYSGRREFEKIQDTLTLTGNYAGITTDKFYKLSDELSNRTHASLGMTKDALMAVMASGNFTEKSISAVTQAVISYAQIAGVDANEAAKKLTNGLDGTASGARSLNREMNFLTLEQYKQIEALEKAGKRQEAAQLAAVALNTQLAAQRRELGYLDKAWETVTNSLSRFWNYVKEIGKPESLTESIDAIDKKIAQLNNTIEQGNNQFGVAKAKKDIALEKEKREAILETMRLQARSVAARDVGNAKQEIEDRAGAGGLDKERQIIAATEKVRAEIRYTQALKSANEIEKIELEAAKQISEKRAEFNAKSEEEKRAMGGLLARQLAAEEVLIEEKKQEKIRLIRQKEKIDIAKAQADERKQFEDMNNQYAQMQATAEFEAKEKTRMLELDKEDLQLRSRMIYASEKEVELAQLKYKYDRLREAGGANLEQLKQQEELEKFNIELRDTMKKTSEVFDSVWGNMSSAIDNFVKTGKLSMKDFARSVIQDLIAIQLKAQAVSLLRMFFAPMVGPQLDAGALPASFNQYLAPKAAAGGTITGPTIVGEKGPELFMPSGTGTIIPNSKMNQMGGTTNVTNNYINAIDTKSFEDRLLGSSNAIWAANQYANKSLAVNRGRA